MSYTFEQTCIGGYFGLEMPPVGGELYPDALRFQSARAAFLALLLAGKPAAVWVPWYICDSMIEPLRLTETRIARYSVNQAFEIHDEIKLKENEWLLYVNYFGIGSAAVENVLKRFPNERVIIDNAQAFFAQPHQCMSTIYSPRKFFGVPDGAYLFTCLPLPEPSTEDIGSLRRTTHLLKRMAFGAEEGYGDFLEAEESLVDQIPRKMSFLTQRMLQRIVYSEAKKRRQENFRYLNTNLGEINELAIDVNNDSVPLCYPFINTTRSIREKLIRARIFVPTYWLEVDSQQSYAPTLERHFVQKLLPLPCDHRYTIQEMEKIVKIVRQLIIEK